MNEPLMYEEARREHGFAWRTYLEPEATADEQRAYLRMILTGQLGLSPAWYFQAEMRPVRLIEHATRDRLVVKFCRLNRMLHWFCRQFEVRGPIFIVRHPCAVVASMLQHGAWDEGGLHGRDREDHALHAESLPASLRNVFDPILDRVQTRVQALATMWCLDHYVPLLHHSSGTYPWGLVPYERLLTHGQDELRRVTDSLDVPMTSEMRDQFDEPSSSVKDELHQDTRRQLSKWRRRLSEDQVAEIMEIVDEVGLTRFYTRDLEPNYDELNRMQRPQSRW
ncbi:hypothetical protein GGP48_002929 [Salinibacter ruber]|nr:hypothetical protein [Salinibacter ruber]